MYDHAHVQLAADQWPVEGIDDGDLTVNLIIGATASMVFEVNAREEMVMAGMDVMANLAIVTESLP
jgi:nicotinate-nucleotide pyrophosphorylase